MYRDQCIRVSVAIALGLGALLVGLPHPAMGTPLDDYVTTPDPNYTYSVANTFSGSGYTAYVLDVTSQTWRDEPNEVDRELWQHWVIIIKPATVVGTRAMLWIGGGSNGGSPPSSAEPMLATIAKATQTVVVEVRMVPNQPIKFADETDPRYIDNGRTEDELIAYAWDKYLRTGDPVWLPRLPMTKAATSAMDATQDYISAVTGGSVTISDFLVGGGSKRGWTTWTTAAVDPRVVAIVPAVIDVLNVEVSMTHHYAAYGFWAPAVQDYVDMNIMSWFGTPQAAAMWEVIDPYAYRDRYTMPKFIIDSAGDQFFLPDSSQFYFDDLPGEKYLRYVPNTDHSLDDSDAPESLLAFYWAILTGTPRPQFSWTFEPDGSIRVQTVDTPTQVTLWHATNPTARDFRQEAIGNAYADSDLDDQGGGVYIGQVPTPPTGWTAFFIELEYASGGPTPFKFTTAVRVVPDAATLTIDVVNALWGRIVEVDPNWPRYYEPNTVLTLTAEAGANGDFKSWKIFDPNHPNDANYATVDTNSVLTLLMNGDRHVQASFKCGSSIAPPGLLLMGILSIGVVAVRRRRRRGMGQRRNVRPS